MEKEMDLEKNIIIKVEYHLEVDIKMEKEMDMEKNWVVEAKYILKENT